MALISGSQTVTTANLTDLLDGGASTLHSHASEIAWQAVKTSAFTAVAGQGYPVNTTSGAITCTLPASASVGDTIQFVDYVRNFATNNLTLNQNSLKFQGDTTPNPVYATAGEAITIVYADATQGWIPTSDGAVSDETPPQPYSVDFLIIAGGGGGGSGASSGAGGAGGYRNSYNNEASGGGNSGGEAALTFTPGTVYTMTVGGGGAAQTNGVNSQLAEAGGYTRTAVGGGDGGDRSNTGGTSGNDGGNGGSGGGGGSTTGDGHITTPGTAEANQGYAGGFGRHVTGAWEGGGGGGGASEVGEDAFQNSPYTGGDGGDGGDGLSSSITGSAVTRGGGGGGNGNAAGVPGAGGGGSPGSAGTANTGGGGGGNSGAGGSGVIIIRMPTASYTSTTSGSPGVTTSGSDTILTFNATGTYTA